MEIYNIESLNEKEILSYVVSYEEAHHQTFSHLFHDGMNKAEIIQIASRYIPITLVDSVENCLYCEERLHKKGLYCDEMCQTLHREEETA